MEARNRNIKDWLTKVRTKQITLPRFQRFEAWGPNLIADLLTNVIRNLPIGSTLVLGVRDNESPFASREIVSAPKEGEKINELLLDGQQRITALWRSLNDTYPDKMYLVYLPGDEEEEKEPYVWCQTRWEKNGKKYPFWVDQPKECWKRKSIPLRLLNPDNELEYKNWAKDASDGDKDVEIEIRDVISSLRAKVANFPIPFLYLDSTTPKDVAIEVFVKLNTRYVRLTAFDIVVAQVEEATGQSLHDLVDSLKGTVPEIIYYTDPSDLVLPSAALLQDRQPNQRGYLNLDFERIIGDWPKIVNGTKELVSFLKEERVFGWVRLPTEAVIAPLVALWAEVNGTPDEMGNIRILLRKYLWRAFFTTRYDRAVPTAVLQDYRALKKVILDEIEGSAVPCFDDERNPLPTKELLIQARWPKYKDRLARAILLLTLRGGAEDIADGTSASLTTIQQREYHHLYPVAWLKENGFDEEDANRALNCILVSWKTNRRISAKEPIKYMLERCEASTLGETEIRRRLKTHFIDFDLLAEGDYHRFLETRANACIDAIKSLCDGNVWRPE
jgi:hypothetical protein